MNQNKIDYILCYGWCKVIEYEYLKNQCKYDKNKYTDECRVTMQMEDESKFTQVVWDINGEYFEGWKKQNKLNK